MNTNTDTKITTRWIKKMIRLGESELAFYKPGSDKWLLVYEQIEVLREWLRK